MNGRRWFLKAMAAILPISVGTKLIAAEPIKKPRPQILRFNGCTITFDKPVLWTEFSREIDFNGNCHVSVRFQEVRRG